MKKFTYLNVFQQLLFLSLSFKKKMHIWRHLQDFMKIILYQWNITTYSDNNKKKIPPLTVGPFPGLICVWKRNWI